MSHNRRGPEEEQRHLEGKLIIVTRARDQSQEMTTALESSGATVLHFPMIELVPLEDSGPLDKAIAQIVEGEYDWLIFTSANAVRFFVSGLIEKHGGESVSLEGVIVCAIGPATARALEAAGLTAQVIAESSTAEGTLEAIIGYLGGSEAVRGLRFLIPRAKVARDVLPDELRKLGASVDAVETYQNLKPEADAARITELFDKHLVDVITFTSPSTISNFSAIVEREDLSELVADTLVACIGPVTLETARRHGLANAICPEQYNSAALVHLIVQKLRTS